VTNDPSGTRHGRCGEEPIVERVPEPELMDDQAQANAYAAADFAEPHDRFVALFRDRNDGWQPREVLDLGCGPADPTRRFARAFPGCRIAGVDGSAAMLALGEVANREAGFAERISLVRSHLPALSLPLAAYDTVISNSLLHHLRDPDVLWTAIARHARSDGRIFVMDLLRPADERAVRSLVEDHAADAPPILRRDFERSLRAAYRPDEIARQLERASLSHLAIEEIGDRHLIVHGPLREAVEEARS
jgi:ubiquinone/menaquinone biosynthesis C-methylase UbiE